MGPLQNSASCKITLQAYDKDNNEIAETSYTLNVVVMKVPKFSGYENVLTLP